MFLLLYFSNISKKKNWNMLHTINLFYFCIQTLFIIFYAFFRFDTESAAETVLINHYPL